MNTQTAQSSIERQTPPRIAQDAEIIKLQEQMSRIHDRAMTGFLAGNIPFLQERLAEARTIAANATRLAKKTATPTQAGHIVWLKNGIASMIRVVQKRQS